MPNRHLYDVWHNMEHLIEIIWQSFDDAWYTHDDAVKPGCFDTDQTVGT